jgi:cellulose synthase/poly-beta-1,6-N-acetylglucosamine synthase-like glycosyltransferase
MEIFFIIALLFGYNLTFWLVVSFLRTIDEVRERVKNIPSRRIDVPFGPEEVAVIIPAHNEELVIEGTVRQLLSLVPKNNIHVVSDGSTDKTASIARGLEVNVLENVTPLGKAGALKKGMGYFQISKHFQAVFFVDADTLIDVNFLKNALPSFSDPEVTVVAGHATTMWNPEKTSFFGMFFVSFRERMYLYMQQIIKYAQTWRRTNMTTIVPGFASIYRSNILPFIDIDPKGLFIEDFNMTFEVQKKRLGRIVYHPDAYAITQDPDNFRDYVRQMFRWNIGFWQTVIKHGLWRSWFSFFLVLSIFECILSSVIILCFPFVMAIFLFPIFFESSLHWEWFLALHTFFNSFLNLKILFWGVFLGDYFMSITAGIFQKRPRYFLYGLGFLFLRFIDGCIYLISIPKACLTRSSGIWKSPTRR